MLFKKKKEEKKEEKKELLYRENIRVNCESAPKEQVIRTVGQMLADSGYVDQPYVSEMLEKEVKGSGIAVMTFPDGVDWDGNEVHVVIGIAGVGEEHLDILSTIADKMLDETAADRLATGDVDTVYQILTGKE